MPASASVTARREKDTSAGAALAWFIGLGLVAPVAVSQLQQQRVAHRRDEFAGESRQLRAMHARKYDTYGDEYDYPSGRGNSVAFCQNLNVRAQIRRTR